MQLAKVMPVLSIARLVGEHDTLIWRMVNHYVGMARRKADHSAVTQVGMDETAARRGHDYVSLFVDMKERRVLLVTPGKDSATVKAFAEDLVAHQGDPKAITEVSLDMSPAFIKGVAGQLPGTWPYFKASARSLSVTFPERCSSNRIANDFGMLRPDS